jgi:hypothetical protein
MNHADEGGKSRCVYGEIAWITLTKGVNHAKKLLPSIKFEEFYRYYILRRLNEMMLLSMNNIINNYLFF